MICSTKRTGIPAQRFKIEPKLRKAINHLNLSARAYHRVLKVTRSIADLAGEATINTAHIAEAVQYRRLNL